MENETVMLSNDYAAVLKKAITIYTSDSAHREDADGQIDDVEKRFNFTQFTPEFTQVTMLQPLRYEDLFNIATLYGRMSFDDEEAETHLLEHDYD